MLQEELKRRWGFTDREIEFHRERFSGIVGHQPGKFYRNHKGIFLHEHTDEMAFNHNLVVNEGLNHALNVELNALAALAVWFLTGFTDAVTPLASHDYAADGVTEITTTNVAEAVRQTYNANVSSSQSTDNVGAVATYIADNTFTMEGMMLKAGNSAFSDITDNSVHILFASTALSPTRAMVALDSLDMTYTFPATAV